MTRTSITAELLAYLLDLPQGAQIVDAQVEGGEIRLGIEHADWPDGVVHLVYEQNSDGVVVLSGIQEIPQD